MRTHRKNFSKIRVARLVGVRESMLQEWRLIHKKETPEGEVQYIEIKIAKKILNVKMRILPQDLGKPSKTTWQIFSVKGGGAYPPFPLSFFEHNDFPLRGRGNPRFC